MGCFFKRESHGHLANLYYFTFKFLVNTVFFNLWINIKALWTHQSMKLWISSWLFVCFLFISNNYFKNDTILLFRLCWLNSFIRLSKIFFDGFGAKFLNDFQFKISSIYKRVLRMICLISESDVLGGCPPTFQA